MPDLFDLAMPWWEFILRAVVVYVVVLGMVRLSGKRALGQVTPFDVLLIVLLGNAVQNALLGTDTSLAGGLLLAATLILLNYGVGWITARSRRMERLIEGEPVVIARNGRAFGVAPAQWIVLFSQMADHLGHSVPVSRPAVTRPGS